MTRLFGEEEGVSSAWEDVSEHENTANAMHERKNFVFIAPSVLMS
jgi:hypothetical protein